MSHANPWPEHWQVSFAWPFMGHVLESRRSEFTIESDDDPQWYTFERYVYNTKTKTDWVDGFAHKPYGAFVSFRPDDISKVRAKRVPPCDG
jgi:hypothetical protein